LLSFFIYSLFIDSYFWKSRNYSTLKYRLCDCIYLGDSSAWINSQSSFTNCKESFQFSNTSSSSGKFHPFGWFLF
jgi:hypothetical protein